MSFTKKIKLSDLLVNSENYRFEPVASQKQAIDMMINSQGDKLFSLAKHIAKFGLNPNDRIQVTLSNHDKTKYNVLEGNRRIIALKALNNPDLIDGSKHSALKKKFRKIHDDGKIKVITEFDCIVYDNPDEADTWIKLKHVGEQDGVGTVRWNAQQVQRYEEKVEGKSPVALQVIKTLQNSPSVPDDLKDNLKDLKITNLDRLLSDPSVRIFLGVEINNGIIESEIDEKEVIKGLTQVTKDLLKTNFNVQKIYTKVDRNDYIKNFPSESIPDTTKRASKPWQFNTTAKSDISRRPKPTPQHRKKLIPKSCVLKINNPKVNSIYHELLKIDITKYTNATAVLFRVFIELSLDCFIEHNNMIKSSSAAKSRLKLTDKVTSVAGYLEHKKYADSAICKGIKFSVKDKNGILGIDTWHAYVHNNNFSPTPQNLILTWNNIQLFIERVWENIK